MQTTQPVMLAGFSRRWFSDLLDALLLGLLGAMLSLPFGSPFWRLGPHCAWLGLAITFLYSGLLQSTLGKGQTLDKRILGIQVLSMAGSSLSLSRSLLRYAMLALISYSGTVTEALGRLSSIEPGSP